MSAWHVIATLALVAQANVSIARQGSDVILTAHDFERDKDQSMPRVMLKIAERGRHNDRGNERNRGPAYPSNRTKEASAPPYLNASSGVTQSIVEGSIQVMNHGLPNFWFIGVSKCATSSLDAGMRKHPLVHGITPLTHSTGEAHIFDKDHGGSREAGTARSLEKVRASVARTFGEVTDSNGSAIASKSLYYEYTPHYLFEEKTPLRICAAMQLAGGHCGESKFVVIIREPVARTLSSWEFKYLSKSGEKMELRTIIDQGRSQAASIHQCWLRLGASATANTSAAIRQCSTKDMLSPVPHDHHARISSAHVGKSLYFYQVSALFFSRTVLRL